MIERVIAHGITLTRSSDPWNDYDAAAVEIDALKKLGMDVIVNVIYSVSPRHTDEYFAERARQAAAIKPYRICFKDVAGLLTPDRARTLIPLIQKNIGDIPLEFHAHCNNGMAPFNYLEAIKLGVDTSAHGDPTAGQWLGATVDLQRGAQRAGVGLPAAASTWRRSSRWNSISVSSENSKAIRLALSASTTTRSICIKSPAA